MTLQIGKLQLLAIAILGLPVILAALAASGSALGYLTACALR
jgi:hypothetical protein